MLTYGMRVVLVSCAVAKQALALALDGEPGPGLYFLHGMHRFYAGDESVSMEVSNMHATGETQGKETVLHIAMVPKLMLTKFVADNTTMCTQEGQFLWSNYSAIATVPVPVNGNQVSVSKKMSSGGEHMFVIVNCQTKSTTSLSGQIHIKSNWGYLDGIQYTQAPIYVCALLVSCIMLVVYLFMLSQQEEELRDPQYYCVVLGGMHVAEAAVVCGILLMQNELMPTWSNLPEACYLAKLMYGLLFIMQTSQGLGFTSQRLDCGPLVTCYVVVFLYLFAATRKICIFSRRLNEAQVMSGELGMAVLPVTVMASLASAWVTWSIGGVLRELRKRDDSEALQACRRIALLLLFVVFSTIVALVGQVFGSSGVTSFIFWNDAVPSVIFTTIVVVLMVFSMQNYVSKSVQMAAIPTGEDDCEAVGIGGVDQASEEEGNENDPLGVKPSTIGATVE